MQLESTKCSCKSVPYLAIIVLIALLTLGLFSSFLKDSMIDDRAQRSLSWDEARLAFYIIT